jgi:NTP pyrophosphatase (non-canonical NTP hydrolase)
MKEVVNKIKEWGKDRGITINGSPMTQAIKTLEETQELLLAINTQDKEGIKDAIGDVVVTLIMQCELQDFELEDCIEHAYDIIKDRKGYLNEYGDFIKNETLTTSD